ncbi:MAG: MFS transporter [Candidatus Omnitrophica bacterium]|nr:MFS transporter [Candidatus Omnitrophota bacterium]MBU1853589.1 MFS transporter [Candidatus Omnitrophota bacterium]
MRITSIKIKKGLLILSWALYDLSNQFFALNVVSLYFPRWLIIEKKSPEILYSLCFGISLFFVGICAPVLGAISDVSGRRKEFLAFFTLLSIIFTVSLGLATNIFWALVFFAIANFGCQGAVVFYNALMTDVAPKHRIGFVSGLGRMFGYSGAILALYTIKPAILGYQKAFIFTGMLFLIFSLPCIVFVKEKSPKYRTGIFYFLEREKLLEAFRRLRTTIFDISKLAELKDFLKASFFGLCAVNAIILFMSIYAGKVFGLKEGQIVNLIAFSTIFAIVGSIFSGFISDIIGYRKSLIGIFFLWGICFLGGGLLKPPFHWLIGALAGISLSSTWVVSRAMVIKIVPEDKIGEAFGLFNLVAYISGIVGSMFYGTIILFFSHLGEIGYRLALLSLTLFIAIGMSFLLKMGKSVRGI